MAKGSHYGRVNSRQYTDQYKRVSAKSFKSLLAGGIGNYLINSVHLTDSHKKFKLIELPNGDKAIEFFINEKTHRIFLIQDNSSASNKLYISCPYCKMKRQHLYAVKNAYACRECLGLHYASQSERPRLRLMRKIRVKRKKIWGNDWPDVNNLFECPAYWSKPKGIGWERFYKEREELHQLELKYWPMVDLYLNKQFGI